MKTLIPLVIAALIAVPAVAQDTADSPAKPLAMTT